MWNKVDSYVLLTSLDSGKFSVGIMVVAMKGIKKCQFEAKRVGYLLRDVLRLCDSYDSMESFFLLVGYMCCNLSLDRLREFTRLSRGWICA